LIQRLTSSARTPLQGLADELGPEPPFAPVNHTDGERPPLVTHRKTIGKRKHLYAWWCASEW
jgi:hypothetical protein